MNSKQSLPSKPRTILVIAMRYLGDVLLTTPLLHSLRQAYPDASLDILVFANTASMLETNFEHDFIEAYNIKLTRDAEIDIDNDLSKSFVEKISKGLKEVKLNPNDPSADIISKVVEILEDDILCRK